VPKERYYYKLLLSLKRRTRAICSGASHVKILARHRPPHYAAAEQVVGRVWSSSTISKQSRGKLMGCHWSSQGLGFIGRDADDTGLSSRPGRPGPTRKAPRQWPALLHLSTPRTVSWLVLRSYTLIHLGRKNVRGQRIQFASFASGAS